MIPATSTRSFSSFRFRTLRRIAATACSLLLATAATAQKFQYDYGAASVAEIGVTVTTVPSGYLIGGTQGPLPIPLGVLANWNGGRIFGVRHPPMLWGPTLTPNCTRRTASGGIIMTGEVGNFVGGLDVFLAYYAPNGALWPSGVMGPNRYLVYRGDGTGIRQGTRVVEMAGGGFAVTTNVDPATTCRGVLFTTAANGLLGCWTAYTYNGLPVRFHDLCQDTDGTFLIVGSIGDWMSPWRRTLVMRTNCGGAPIWAFAYAGPALDSDVEQHAITATAGGCFAVWGHYAPATSPTPGSFLFEVNGAGGINWYRRFPNIAGSRPTISRCANGDLLANGRVGGDGLVLRTNSAGGAPVARTYGTATSVDELFQVLPTTDGGFVASGSTQIVDTPSTNTWLIKADANGDTSCNWQPYAVAPYSLGVYGEYKQLQTASTPQMYYLYMSQVQQTAPATQLCFTPGPIVYTGDPAPTTVALPGITASHPPFPGDPAFRIDTSGLVPNGFSMIALSTAMAPSPLPLAMFGAQPDAMLYGDPSLMTTYVVAANANGESSLAFPIPNNPAFVGLGLHWQVFDIDVALPFPLPIGNSQAMSVVIQ